ncbi:MAG: stage II sporulation protein M [Nitrososphaerota archaeon]|nr:stage II sporulation protein M [Nitrososphaerales archaeon]MCX8191743.1 stage II sporulation protein M [Nitrososphaerales archaeon]MDW8044586.1 stage II sporulation protein M [Nitrososphaerota archaeon]
MRFKVAILIAILLIFISFSLGFFRGQDASLEDIKEIERTIKGLEKTPSFIFFNNFLIASATLIPLIGIFLHLFVQFNTGYVIGALTSSINFSDSFLILTFVISPVFILEYSAYTITLGESINLTTLSLRRAGFRSRLKMSLKILLIAAILLFIGALVESYLIMTFMG